jgi:xylulose-5-phosphate/fructose-6-phosphate phosphoketolase
MTAHASGVSAESAAGIAAPPAELSPYLRAANYLAAVQIYLRGNCLLEEPLRPEHVKPRLLGHWGTCPGINLIYAGLNQLILQHRTPLLLVTGPGHGAPANLANLWLEGSLEDLDRSLSRDRAGLEQLVTRFSWPGGFPSHLAAMVPGVIHEGGELGYALATAFGAAFDNPDLLVACIVGDGEAETGPTATAWHSTKFLDPEGSGAVLPILHLNGYKISNPTVFGTMSGQELVALFEGYGWRPHLVEGPDYEEDIRAALVRCYAEIQAPRDAARHGDPMERPRWPMLILRSPKGWTGIRELDGVPIEGTFRAHQVPAKDAAENPAHLKAVEEWLRSYRPTELFGADGRPVAEVLESCPQGELRMGARPEANGGSLRVPLALPELERHATAVTAPGAAWESALEATGRWLADAIRANPRSFRIVCPDELESNRLGAVLEATERAYEWPVGPNDVHQAHAGRVTEMLSEHNCQGWLQGYILTGRHGLFPCYEAFVPIVDGMVSQYAKFLKMSAEVPWRRPVSSFNYLLTSEGWRQEHNGYSHQGPGFINTMLNKKESVVRVYLPADANTMLATMEHCLKAVDTINVIIASKQPLPQWLSMSDARKHCFAGASRWGWASNDGDGEPDVVLASAGTIPTIETLAAASLLREDVPELRIRVVNLVDLLVLAAPGRHPHAMNTGEFESLFTRGRPVIFDFHGYPSAVHQLLHRRPEPDRFHVKGYIEEGTTTTPFDLLAANGVTRYHIAIEALHRVRGWASRGAALVERYERLLREHRRYILEHGEDPPEIRDWTWS